MNKCCDDFFKNYMQCCFFLTMSYTDKCFHSNFIDETEANKIIISRNIIKSGKYSNSVFRILEVWINLLITNEIL